MADTTKEYIYIHTHILKKICYPLFAIFNVLYNSKEVYVRSRGNSDKILIMVEARWWVLRGSLYYYL